MMQSSNKIMKKQNVNIYLLNVNVKYIEIFYKSKGDKCTYCIKNRGGYVEKGEIKVVL